MSRPTRRLGGPLLALLAAVILLSGCTLRGNDDNANGGLANTSWVVTSIGAVATLADARPTMAFAPEGVVSGSGGCNTYCGPFRTDGGGIEVGDLASTMMLCEGERGAQEAAFLGALAGASEWRQTEAGTLELAGAGAALTAEPLAAPGPGPDDPAGAGLPGSTWVLTALGGSEDTADIFPTIEFGADGTVSGFAGCNRYNGSYSLDGTTLSFGPLAATKMGCPPPASEVEAAFLQAMSGVTSFTLAPDRLVLDGPVILAFGPG